MEERRGQVIPREWVGLAIIGTADGNYNAAAVTAEAHPPTLEWRVYEGVNHGLEVEGDWQASLRALADIMQACAAFLG